MPVKHSVFLILFFSFILGLSMPYSSIAQTEDQPEIKSLEPKALEISQIPDFGNRTRALISGVQSIVDNSKEIDEISPGIKDLLKILDNKFLEINDTITTFRLTQLNKTERELALFNERIIPWKSTIETIYKDCGTKDSLIISMSEVWQLTLKSLSTNRVKFKSDKKSKTNTLVDLNLVVKNFIFELKTSKKNLVNYTERLINLQTKITLAENKLGNIKSLIESSKEELESNLWTPQYPPIWRVEKSTKQINIRGKLTDLVSSDRSIVQTFISNYPKLPYYGLLFFVMIFGIVLYLKANSKKLHDEYKNKPKKVNLVLKNPFLNVLAILWFILMLFSILPKELNDMISIIMAIPLIIVLYSLNNHWKWYSVLTFILVYSFFLLIKSIDYNYLPQRLFLVFLNGFSLFLYFRLKSQKKLLQQISKFWFGILPFIIQLFIVIGFISLITNIFGGIRLTQLLIHASFGILISIYVLPAIVLLIQDIVFIFLMGPLAKHSNILKEDSDIVLNTMGELFRFFGFLSFISIFLNLLGIRAETIDIALSIINYQLNIGQMSLSLGNIIAFFVALKVSLWLSDSIRYVLEKEVYPRTHLKTGIPNTISLIIKFSFSILGILFAFSAAGIEIGKLAILMGALGVGIGFGLQNIINNFVSGIILALERPITIGDIIDVPGASGYVEDIGLRASTVYTWEGSHVIVPNGELLSNKLTNWTFTNRLRRVKVEVRVPFNTDMEALSNLLLKTAGTTPEVMKKPKPYLNFKGIGRSTMEINLYCWINDSDKIFTYGTAIRKTVYKTLLENGYDIPVPRQDLKIDSEIE